MQQHEFETRRTACPSCGHKDCFAKLKDAEGGKCFSCGAFFPPPHDNHEDAENVSKSQHSPQPEEVEKTIYPGEVDASLAYVSQIPPNADREYTDTEERVAIYEYEAGMTREEAEQKAGMTIAYNNPPNARAEELIQLHSPFARLLVRLTRPSILTDWSIGLTAGGDTLFWYRNKEGAFVNAKAVRFEGLHRDKQHNPYFLYGAKDGFGTCLYGEHQLAAGYTQYDGTLYNSRTKIFLVESEKTAIIMSHAMPRHVWLASGGASGLTERKARVLNGYTVFILYDCDEAGRNGAEHARDVLRNAGALPRVIDQFAHFPNAPEGYDAADMIMEYNKHLIEGD